MVAVVAVVTVAVQKELYFSRGRNGGTSRGRVEISLAWLCKGVTIFQKAKYIVVVHSQCAAQCSMC